MKGTECKRNDSILDIGYWILDIGYWIVYFISYGCFYVWHGWQRTHQSDRKCICTISGKSHIYYIRRAR